MAIRSQLANMVPSVFWTVAFLSPVYLFCAHHLSLRLTILFLVVGVVSMSIPKATLARLVLSEETATYRRFHVTFLIRITQDAGWLRRLGGLSDPRARRDQKVIRTLIRDTWMRERFHLGLFTFCLLCSFAALSQLHLIWFLALLCIDVLYNLYPIWLQQYLRLRLTRCQRLLAP